MTSDTPVDLAQLLYDRAEIDHLDEDMLRLDQWAKQPDVLDTLVNKDFVKFDNVSVGKSRALWMVIGKHRPDLLVALLDKVADHGMLAPQNVIITTSLIDPKVRQPLIHWLTHGPDADPTLGLSELREMTAAVMYGDKHYEDSLEWVEAISDVAQTVNEKGLRDTALWLASMHSARCLRKETEISNVQHSYKNILVAMINGGLDIECGFGWDARATSKTIASKQHFINLVDGLAYEYCRHDCMGLAPIAAAVSLGADWKRVAEDPNTTAESRSGLEQHPLVRNLLLQDRAVVEKERPKHRQKF